MQRMRATHLSGLLALALLLTTFAFVDQPAEASAALLTEPTATSAELPAAEESDELLGVATDDLLKWTTFALGGVTFLLMAWSLWRLRKPHPLRWVTPLIAIIGSVGAVAVSIFLLGVDLDPVGAGVLAAVGVGVGLMALALIRVELIDGKKFVKRSQWFLALWGFSLIGMQVVSVLDSPNSLAAGIAAAIIGAGLVTTLNLGLLIQRFSRVPAA